MRIAKDKILALGKPDSRGWSLGEVFHNTCTYSSMARTSPKWAEKYFRRRHIDEMLKDPIPSAYDNAYLMDRALQKSFKGEEFPYEDSKVIEILEFHHDCFTPETETGRDIRDTIVKIAETLDLTCDWK